MVSSAFDEAPQIAKEELGYSNLWEIGALVTGISNLEDLRALQGHIGRVMLAGWNPSKDIPEKEPLITSKENFTAEQTFFDLQESTPSNTIPAYILPPHKPQVMNSHVLAIEENNPLRVLRTTIGLRGSPVHNLVTPWLTTTVWLNFAWGNTTNPVVRKTTEAVDYLKDPETQIQIRLNYRLAYWTMKWATLLQHST